MKKLYFILFILLAGLSSCDKSSSNPSSNNNPSNNTGVGGSMARFTIANNHLYVVSNSSLKTYNVSNSAQPALTSTIELHGTIETIFPYENYLFIGSQSGVYIYDISNPDKPEYVSIYTHITSCDPVVVSGNYAYATLSTRSTRCNRGVNELDVINISNLNYPTQVSNLPLSQPEGLGIKDSTLYVCQGENGLAVVDVSMPSAPRVIKTITDMNTYDLIPYNNLLMVVGPSGLSQYDITDAVNPKHLSDIKVVQ